MFNGHLREAICCEYKSECGTGSDASKHKQISVDNMSVFFFLIFRTNLVLC